MAQEHTPGPWLIHGALLGHIGDVFSPTAQRVTDCHHIARCFAPKPSEPLLSDLHALQAEGEAIAIIEANARLIAAAPDLLEWAKSALADHDESGSISLAGIGHLRSAVAKAEGK